MTSRVVIATIVAVCLARSVANAETSAAEIVFARDIQPLLAKHCLLCHGPDEAEAGLRLDLAEHAQAKLDSGERAIVAAKAEQSELLRRVLTGDESLRMPPEGERLSAEEIERLRQWIDSGAKYEVHWAYRPVANPSCPDVTNESWIRNPIDRFVFARLQEKGMDPSVEADRATLIKRLSYDLVGLPPTPNEVDAFVEDDDADAYERLIDRLLGSEHFGERWGRHWLDKARYADSDGYEKDKPRPNAWRYRDWVIEAINRDMPLDQFTIEQLAGDLLPNASPLQKLATAFHRQTLTNTEGGTDQEEFRVEATFDRTETTAAVWMGLTMTCARCHSHKYDQITQHEYYQLFSFFNNADEANTDVARNERELVTYRNAQEIHNEQVAEITKRYEAAKKALRPQIDEWTQQMTGKIVGESPVEFTSVPLVEAKTDSEAELTQQQDQSILASGPAADKDQYTLVLKAPKLPLTGIKIEVLTDESLKKKGPGRAPNGNFVLSEVRAYLSDDREFREPTRIEFANAEADFSQNKFAPEGALQAKEKSGWAISPKMGKNHEITFFLDEPTEIGSDQFLQIVLDQKHGGQHTIGRFRVTARTGLDPLRALPKEVAEALRLEKRTEKHDQVIADHVASLHVETAKLAKQIAALQEKAPKSPMIPVRVITPATRTTKVLHRGDFLQPSEEVTSDALAVIRRTHPLESRQGDKPADRLDLARWLVDENHPLTPRVTVNHVWAHLFGRGIVPTASDFGVRGEAPTHPELLDWLAWQLSREMGWSRKTLIKTIVMSATYRQSSHHRRELETIDPTNRLLARQNRVRVEAEVVRDLYLAVSGLMSEKVGGPSVFPPLPPGVSELSYNNNFKWKTSEGGDQYRRGMYTFFKRTSPHPTLISFDCPDSNTTRLQRDTSNTPLQALVTLNNDVFAETAQAMANRVLAEGGLDETQRLVYALRLCIARQPKAEEVAQFRGLLSEAMDYYESHEEDAAKLTSRHAATNVSKSENAAWVATLRMILNLDEFIVRD